MTIRAEVLKLAEDGRSVGEIAVLLNRHRTSILRHVDQTERARVNASRARRKREAKETVVAEKGGKCVLCGYSKYVGALEFHHTDPTVKDAAISRCSSLETMRKEVEKCVLVCSNCHKELEAGVLILQVDL